MIVERWNRMRNYYLALAYPAHYKSTPVGIAWVATMDQVNPPGRKDAHQGSWICQPAHKKNASH